MKWRAFLTEPANLLLTLAGVLIAIYGTWWTIRHQAPRTLDAGLANELSAILRPICADGVIENAERQSIDRFATDRASDVPTAEIQNLEKSICVASQSLTRGAEFVARDRPNEALAEFRSAVRIDPGNAAGWSNLGSAHLLLHQIRDAREAFEEALRLDPLNWVTRYNLACLYDQMGEDRPAIDQFGQALLTLLKRPESHPTPVLLRSVEADPALAALRADGCYQRLASKFEATKS